MNSKARLVPEESCLGRLSKVDLAGSIGILLPNSVPGTRLEEAIKRVSSLSELSVFAKLTYHLG